MNELAGLTEPAESGLRETRKWPVARKVVSWATDQVLFKTASPTLTKQPNPVPGQPDA